jgi:hypothetical protein
MHACLFAGGRAANAGALKAITRAKASMETRVFIVFPPVRGGPGWINDFPAAFAQKVLPNVAIAQAGAQKKRGPEG